MNESVDLAVDEQLPKINFRSHCFERNVSRQLEPRPVRVARLMYPTDLFEADIVFVLQQRPRPHIRGHLVARRDSLSLEIARPLYSGLLMDENVGMPEGGTNEDRQGEDRKIVLRRSLYEGHHPAFHEFKCRRSAEKGGQARVTLGREREVRLRDTPIEESFRPVVPPAADPYFAFAIYCGLLKCKKVPLRGALLKPHGAGSWPRHGRTADSADAANPCRNRCHSACAPRCGYGGAMARHCPKRCRTGDRIRSG